MNKFSVSDMDDLNFLCTHGVLRVYCFIYGHGSRTISVYRDVTIEQVPKLVECSCLDFLSKTRFKGCKKVFSYKFDF